LPKPEREDDPVSQYRCRGQELVCGQILNDDDEPVNSGEIALQVIHRGEPRDDRAQSAPLAVAKESSNLRLVRIKQRKSPSPGEAVIEIVEEEIVGG
jgi:hypothetical protein